MPLSTPFQLANDSEMRLLLAYSGPPRAGRITAVNTASYTVEIADGDNATIEAWPLDGAVYAAGNVVYILQAENAPDSGIIVGRKGALTRLGIGTSTPDGPLHVENTTGGGGIFTAASVAGTAQTLLSAGVVPYSISGMIHIDAAGTYTTATLSLAVPGAGYAAQNVTLGATTIQFRLQSTGQLQVIRTAGTSTPNVIINVIWL